MGSSVHINKTGKLSEPLAELLLRASVTKASDADVVHWEELAQGINDWELFTRKAYGAHLSPLLSKSLLLLNEGVVPDHVLARLASAHLTVLRQNIRLYAHFEELVTGWSEHGIEVIPLKGIFLAERVYGDIGLRHLSDMDLLVRPVDVNTILETATNLGWQVKEIQHHSAFFQTEFGSHHPFKLLKDGTVVELHVHVHGPGVGFAVNIEDLWHRSLPGTLSGCAIRQLDSTDMLQHLCMHLYKHLQAMELKMSSFCDIRELLRKQPMTDWDALMERSALYGIDRQVGVVLFLCCEFWGCNVPDAVLRHIPVTERERCAAQFFTLFKHGRPEQEERWGLALRKRLAALRATAGVKGKLNFIQGYVLPQRPYLEELYGSNHALPVLRATHVLMLTKKTLHALARHFNWRKTGSR